MQLIKEGRYTAGCHRDEVTDCLLACTWLLSNGGLPARTCLGLSLPMHCAHACDMGVSEGILTPITLRLLVTIFLACRVHTNHGYFDGQGTTDSERR